MTISSPIRRLLVGLTVLLVTGAVPASTWRSAADGYPWSFPEDHWSHPAYQTEWWYLTGHLTEPGATTPRFGYQFTIFRIGLLPDRPGLDSAWNTRDLIMGHASLTDLETGSHVFSDVLYRTTPLLGGFGVYPDSTLGWCRAPAGTPALWSLRCNGAAFDVTAEDQNRGLSFTLSTRPERPLLFQGPGGVSPKGNRPEAASLYYSFTRLATTGRVTVDGRTLEVSGTSWMDKEFGSNQLTEDQVGWDWFSLQLEDGREFMLYLLRDASGGTDFARGTLVPAEGPVRYIGAEAWTLEVRDRWTSPETGAVYPSGWRLRIPGEAVDLRIEPALRDQENIGSRSGHLFYWEGAVEIRDTGTGRPLGRGYVELTGYGEGNRPPI